MSSRSGGGGGRSTRSQAAKLNGGSSSNNNSNDDLTLLLQDDLPQEQDSIRSLSQRLINFRKWLTKDANATLHPAVCIVNGEATDGTKNAPVLIVEANHHYHHYHHNNINNHSSTSNSGNAGSGVSKKRGERIGVVDAVGDQALYEDNMGCEVRAIREIKEGERILSLPRAAMVTPDVLAASAAGRAVRACCQQQSGDFWDVFENTTILQNSFEPRVFGQNGAQLLIKILHERKKVENALKKRMEGIDNNSSIQTEDIITLAAPKSISTRAVMLAFLIQQRFASEDDEPFIAAHHYTDDGVNGSGGNSYTQIQELHDWPTTFAPYVRTLPSSVPLPLCWQRNELALLSSCHPGISIMQDVTTNTMLLATEFIELIDAGLLERFPDVFPPGCITWDRWVWAAAVYASRALPVTCYLNDGDVDAVSFTPTDKLEFQSPSEVWQELGVMVPFLDMLNHEINAHQITWKPASATTNDNGDSNSSPIPGAITHKRVKKDEQLYCCYGLYDNTRLLQQYGFTQLNNSADSVKIGWSLSDATGLAEPPLSHSHKVLSKGVVFESSDAETVNKWWTDSRLSLLKKEALSSVHIEASFIDSLKAGKQMTTNAFNNGMYCPIFLTVAVVATMPQSDVDTLFNGDSDITKINSKHQTHLRAYLAHYFLRKLQKLLNMLHNALNAHIPMASFSTEMHDLVTGTTKNETAVTWNRFFENAVRKETLHVEDNFYSTGTDSSVLSLCNGHIRALQSSVEALLDDIQYENGLIKQLADIGFELTASEEMVETSVKEVSSMTSVSANGARNNSTREPKSPKNRKRNRSRTSSDNSGRKVNGIKLHIGNLAYNTRASDLYDYFTSKYGRENVLDCHIPIEKDSGRSRGFGFVTLPDRVASDILANSARHEIHGRTLKVAKSSSSGATPPINVDFCNGPPKRDRCRVCGYSPRYCTCGGDKPIPPRDEPAVADLTNGRRRSYEREVDRHREPDVVRTSVDRHRDGDRLDDPYRGSIRRPHGDYDPYLRDRELASRDRGGGFDRERYGARDGSYERSASSRMMPSSQYLDKNGDRSHDRDYNIETDSRGYGGGSSSRRGQRHRSRSPSRGRKDRRHSRSRTRSRSHSRDRDRDRSSSRSRERSHSRGRSKKRSSTRKRRARSESYERSI